MGEVWRARHHRQGVEVAVKVITAKAARRFGFLEAFRNEVQAVARLSHPNIVAVLDFGEISAAEAEASEGMLVEASPYMVMELANRLALDPAAAFTWSQLREVLRALLLGLGHACPWGHPSRCQTRQRAGGGRGRRRPQAH
jgi:serine/threonine protein kinase